MKAEITFDGHLVLYPETTTEGYAAKQYCMHARNSDATTSDLPEWSLELVKDIGQVKP